MCRDADLFEKAIIREVEVYDPDMLVVGCDVYNVEAEAAGCEVSYPDSNDVPAVSGRVLRPGDDISRLRLPDPRATAGCPFISRSGGASRRGSAGTASSGAP